MRQAVLLATLLLAVASLAVSPARADDDILAFIPEILGTCTGCQPRLVVVNNCDDNAVALFKVTGNDQWNFLIRQGGQVIYTDYVNSAGDEFIRFNLGARGAANAQKTFLIPDIGACSGNLSFQIGCSPNTDAANPWYQCQIGDVPGTDLFGANFLFEPTFGCSQAVTNRDPNLCQINLAKPSERLTTTDYLDISAVDAYTVPFKWEVTNPTAYNCSQAAIDANMLDLASCPSENNATMTMTSGDQATYASTYAIINTASGFSLLTSDVTGATGTINKACVSPGKWLTTTQLGNPVNPTIVAQSSGTSFPASTSDWYSSNSTCGEALTSASCTCPGCGGVQTYQGIPTNYTLSTPLTNYVTRLKEIGYLAGYTWAYDDASGLITCNQGAVSTLTLCPNGGKPYSQSQTWWYDSTSQTCKVVNSNTPGGATQYNSIFQCQQTAIGKYSIVSEALTSQNGLTATVYYCTIDPSGTYTYSACKTQVQTLNAGGHAGAALTGAAGALMCLK